MPDKPEVREKSAPDQTESAPRVGVYVCECGGNIGDTVRCEEVARTLENLPNVAVARRCQFMCSDLGQQLIIDDIRQTGINRVVVGACSLFLHEQTFRRAVQRAGLNPYLYYHVGLREQDSWVHHGHSQAATDKAIRLMSAGVAKARHMQPLEPVRLSAEKHVLVIGGGVAGLRAALSLARRGLRVTLIEKKDALGGHVAEWERLFPNDRLARTLLDELIEKVQAEPNITILTGTQLVAAKGYVGNFEIHLRHKVNRNGGLQADDVSPEFELKVGAVVVATGFQPYEPFNSELGYGEFPEVITLPQLEPLLSDALFSSGHLEWNGRPVRSIAMIHCVGSRQVEGVHQPQPDGQVNAYCSRVCCTATLAAANQIREHCPGVRVFDIYQDIRTYGRGHEEYYRRASKNRVTFLRYVAEEPPEVTRGENGAEHPMLVKVKDRLTWGEEIELPVDLVVLAVGMMPSPVQDLIKMLKVTPGNDRFLLEVHPKLRPVETAVPGVVLAGTAQGPMNVQESSAAAEAAASKVAVLLGQGKVELEPYVARVDPTRCEGAGECVRVCPQEDAIHLETMIEDGKEIRRAVVTSANCNGCGVCVSACPNRAIDVQGWRLDEYEAMVQALTSDLPVLEPAI